MRKENSVKPISQIHDPTLDRSNMEALAEIRIHEENKKVLYNYLLSINCVYIIYQYMFFCHLLY